MTGLVSVTGRAFVFGDDIDTDVLAPGSLMKLAPEALARHCLEAVDPAFAAAVKPGDLVFAGRNFGLGSSREQAAVSLKLLGVGGVLAKSFARIFFRNAINLGLPVFTLDHEGFVAAGDAVRLDVAGARVENVSRGAARALAPLPPEVLAILDAGGLMPLLQRRFASSATS